MAITRKDPAAYLARIFEPLIPAEPAIKLEVTEDDKAYHVKAEMPGVKKEDIAVDVDGNQVSLAATLKRQTDEKKENVVHTERYYGRQFRSFTLGQDIDAKAVKAKFAEGVLDLTLPKSGVASSTRVAIQ